MKNICFLSIGSGKSALARLKWVILGGAALVLSGCLFRETTYEMLPPPAQEELIIAARHIAGLTYKSGFAAYNLYEGNMLGTELYAVAVSPELEEEIEDYPGAGVIYEFIRRNLTALRRRNMHVGAWYNSALGRTYVDIFTTLPALDQAADLAASNGQEVVYDLKNGREIFIDRDGVQTPAEAPYQ